MTHQQIDWGTCHREACDELCPWDMSGIIVDEEIFCSPRCAKAVIEARIDEPTTVKLHDPQFQVDRDEIGIDENAVDIWRLGEPAEKMIDRYAELYPAEFRIDH